MYQICLNPRPLDYHLKINSHFLFIFIIGLLFYSHFCILFVDGNRDQTNELRIGSRLEWIKSLHEDLETILFIYFCLKPRNYFSKYVVISFG